MNVYRKRRKEEKQERKWKTITNEGRHQQSIETLAILRLKPVHRLTLRREKRGEKLERMKRKYKMMKGKHKRPQEKKMRKKVKTAVSQMRELFQC